MNANVGLSVTFLRVDTVCANDLAFEMKVEKSAVLNTVIAIILCLCRRLDRSAHPISTGELKNACIVIK